MNFLTSTILSGIAWDGLKKFGELTGEYIKSQLKDWILDDTAYQTIAKKINEISPEFKKSRKFLEAFIEDDEELLKLLESAQYRTEYVQDNSYASIERSNMINGNNNTVIVIEGKKEGQEFLKESRNFEIKYADRNSLRCEMKRILIENRQIFNQYGPTDNNKKDIFSRKVEVWRTKALNTIVPNNRKIVKMLEDNKDMLTDDEYEIFIRFKLHAEGFEDNQKRKERNSEYPIFPEEIDNILS